MWIYKCFFFLFSFLKANLIACWECLLTSQNVQVCNIETMSVTDAMYRINCVHGKSKNARPVYRVIVKIEREKKAQSCINKSKWPKNWNRNVFIRPVSINYVWVIHYFFRSFILEFMNFVSYFKQKFLINIFSFLLYFFLWFFCRFFFFAFFFIKLVKHMPKCDFDSSLNGRKKNTDFEYFKCVDEIQTDSKWVN